jgi:hypothetical protein
MRLYQLYDYLLSFKFEAHNFKGTEYIVVNDNVIDELYVKDFKRDNLCFDDRFLSEKLSSIKAQLGYFQTLIEKGLEDFDGNDNSKSLFRLILLKLQNKGLHFNTPPFNGNARIVYFLIFDLLDLIENRIKIVDAILSGYDYSLDDQFVHYEIIMNRKTEAFYKLNGYPTKPDWYRIRANDTTWPKIAEDYRFYFKPKALLEYPRLFEINDIQSATKEKVRMFFKLLRDYGHFKYKLENEELAELISIALDEKYTSSFINKEKSGTDAWKHDYGGHAIPNFL